eukprot:1296901-Ditylum_brightwellii.AAC.1
MAKICFHCSKGVMADICSIMKEISSVNSVESKTIKHILQCHVPFEYKDIRCNITESNQSIWKNLPCPDGVIIEDHIMHREAQSNTAEWNKKAAS